MPLSCHFYLDLSLHLLRSISRINSQIITSTLSMILILAVGFIVLSYSVLNIDTLAAKVVGLGMTKKNTLSSCNVIISLLSRMVCYVQH